MLDNKRNKCQNFVYFNNSVYWRADDETNTLQCCNASLLINNWFIIVIFIEFQDPVYWSSDSWYDLGFPLFNARSDKPDSKIQMISAQFLIQLEELFQMLPQFLLLMLMLLLKQYLLILFPCQSLLVSLCFSPPSCLLPDNLFVRFCIIKAKFSENQTVIQ